MKNCFKEWSQSKEIHKMTEQDRNSNKNAQKSKFSFFDLQANYGKKGMK